MNISGELATCVATIKSWDVFPDQEQSRAIVIGILEKYVRGLEVRRGAYAVLENCDHRPGPFGNECLCGAPMPLTRKGKCIVQLQQILESGGFDSA